MELLRKIYNFTQSKEDKLLIYKMNIKSILDQSSVVLNANLSIQNERELERVQKVSVKLISGNYETYSKALKDLNLETLKERRQRLTKVFQINV